MTLFKNKYRTESHRLKNWDYSSQSIYFITLVTQNRKCIFGSIENEQMILNANGKIIETELLKSIEIRERWFFHNWVIMPNHVHILVEILELSNNNEMSHVETHCSASLQQPEFSKSNYSTITILPEDTDIEIHNLFLLDPINFELNQSQTNNNVETHCSASLQQQKQLSRKPHSISSFVAIFKSITTKQINSLLDIDNSDSIWQSNYHDHIVRNYNTFDKIYYYIKNNPKNWDSDSINPH